MIQVGYCQCGCGERTPLAAQTDRRRGLVKGRPRRFIDRHATRGERSPQWRGGVGYKTGYATTIARSHPRADDSGRVLEHILIAEAALGKPLPPGTVVHHTDEQRGRVNPRGLVICPDDSYHRLLHQRSRALEACGHADWRKCNLCKTYDAPEKLYILGTQARHTACIKLYSRVKRSRAALHSILQRRAA